MTLGKITSVLSIPAFLISLIVMLMPLNTQAAFEPSGKLEIRYINVGQGGSTLIIGPDGTRVLYDFGRVAGKKWIVPYLKDRLKLAPEQGFHYSIVSHRDADHFVGYRGVVNAGYDFLVANYGPGSPKFGPSMNKNWLMIADKTTAGPVRPIPVGLSIALGDGATLNVIAANGSVYLEDKAVRDARKEILRDENDRSVALFIRYGKFTYILDGDLGGGRESCTGHKEHQIDVQTPVAEALFRLNLLEENETIDVMHVAHHGSPTSTPARYFNRVSPKVALISVGPKQSNFKHPRDTVVDRILIGENRADCLTAPPVDHVLQTDLGKAGTSSQGSTSFTGTVIGDIELITDGITNYTIRGSFHTEGPSSPPLPDIVIPLEN